MRKKKSLHGGVTSTTSFLAIEDLQQIQNISSIQPINLDYCGSEQCESGYTFGPFVRTSYVLHMVVSGKGTFFKGDEVFSVTAGSAFLIYPEEETIYQADREDPWYYQWIGFHGFQAEEMMARAGFSRQSPVVSFRNMPKISLAMEQMLAARELSYVNELRRMSALYAVLALLSENNEELAESVVRQTGSADSAYVHTAVQLLLGSYQKGIRISDIARTIGISRNYLTSIFKKEMNVSPQEFLMNYRMEKAGSLLTTTDEPISIIALEVGYEDSLSFSKAFHKRFGLSPTDYRASYKANPSMMQEFTSKGAYTSEAPL